MSIVPMYKRCPNCKRQFTYNPSIGVWGLCARIAVRRSLNRLLMKVEKL